MVLTNSQLLEHGIAVDGIEHIFFCLEQDGDAFGFKLPLHHVVLLLCHAAFHSQ